MKLLPIALPALLLAAGVALRADDAPEPRFAAMSPDAVRAYERDTLRRVADLALVPPVLDTSPLPRYDYDKLDYGMTIGIERTPKGRLWACWVAGGDSPKAFFVLATSDDDGETWSKPRLVVDSHSPTLPRDRSILVGNLWTDPLGRLWLIFDQSMEMFDGRGGVWASVCENPDAEKPAWSSPRRIWHGVTLNKPTVLSTGEWMLPISLDQRDGTGDTDSPQMFGPFRGLFPELDPFRGANVFVSTDKGATWQRRGAVRFPNPDWHEHMIVERRDRSLWMLARTAKGIMQSTSTDGGRTWTEPTEPPGIRQPNARFHVRRLASGRLLLVKHGDRIDAHEGRVQLSAWLSDDDGATWQGGLVLDERKGISYPDGFQAPDGTIYVSYDRNRATDGEILLARFTEADVLAKKLVGPKSKLTMLISRPLAPKAVPGAALRVPGAASGVPAGPRVLPPGWDPKAAADLVLARLVRVSAPQVKGAHDAEFVCVGDRAYVVEHDNDVEPGHGAGKAMYCVLTVVNLKTLAVEGTIPLARSAQAFDNVTLPEGMCFVPRIIRKDDATLRCYFASENPGQRQAQTWYRDFDLRTGAFAGSIHKAKLKTAAGTFDMEPRHFHADAVARGFTKPPSDYGLYIFDSFKEFAGRRHVALNNFPGKQNALAVLLDDFATFEVIGHYNEPQAEQLSESAVNRLPDGTWMAICRNDKGTYHFTTSVDGKTWTVAAPRPWVPNGLNSKPTFDRFGDVYYLGWQENTRVGDCSRSVFNVDVSRDGKSWERKYRFESPHSFQYPTFHEHAGSIWLAVTQSDHKGSSDRIMFGRLEDLTVPAAEAAAPRAFLGPAPDTAAQIASLRPPRHLGLPRPEQAATNRAFTGIPSMAVTPRGRLWATWYAGVTPGEDPNNYVVLSTAAADGGPWEEVLTVDPDGEGPVRAFDPELWLSPDGRLFLFWAQMDRKRRDPQLGVWCVETAAPDQSHPRWSAPRRIGDGVMMCKPLTLSTGEWALPISLWREHDKSAQIVVSNDEGKTWSVRGGCNVPKDDRQFDEHMIVERKDGSLWMLARTNYGIGESASADRGATWPDLKPSALPHTPSRFFVQRLASGSLLLVKHGPLGRRTGRSDLTAFVSTDDGVTWSGGLLLDERAGVSYPDGQQTADGTIRIIYDYSRVQDREILMATFREADAAAGKDVTGGVRLRQVVSKASGGQKPQQQTAASVHANADGKPLLREPAGRLANGGAAAQPLVAGAPLFSDRGYAAARMPPALAGARFLPISMEGSKTITCDRAGMVFFLTPVLERNRDSAAQPLLDQGFEKVALPEVPLFNPGSAANYCTLFQKRCVVGETIIVGKWAVPVFFP